MNWQILYAILDGRLTDIMKSTGDDGVVTWSYVNENTAEQVLYSASHNRTCGSPCVIDINCVLRGETGEETHVGICIDVMHQSVGVNMCDDIKVLSCSNLRHDVDHSESCVNHSVITGLVRIEDLLNK